jgi:DNA helicase II / ATP-dependent DNA helicase PcrA
MELNKEQLKAADSSGGVTLVIAGAGTGKTRTIIHKVNNLIKTGNIKPENILVMTFSRKAAIELKERILKEIGDIAQKVTSGTFHSFCLDFLKDYIKCGGEAGGYNQIPSVITNEERDDIIGNIIRSSLADFMGIPVDVIRILIDNPGRIDGHSVKKLNKFDIFEKIDNVKNKFILYKKENNLIDFEDMINCTISILKKDNKARRMIQEKYDYVLIDEFQDTSENNFRFIRLIIKEAQPNLFVVGDDWQSIYGFRKARIEYMLNMKKYFKAAKVIKLAVNYRSRNEIVKASSDFIRKNRSRTRKNLRSYKGPGGKVEGFRVYNHEDECKALRDILSGEMNAGRSTAVLYRNNRQGEYIRIMLRNFLDLHGDRISLMTIHSSKGLEFDSVVIAGVSDNILPDKTADIEEERRLFYVALTRAKEMLYILHHIPKGGTISRFARELGLSPDIRREFNRSDS